MNSKGNINGIFKADDQGLVLVYPDINPRRAQDVSFIQENINDPILPDSTTQSVDQTIDQLNEMDFMYVTEKGLLLNLVVIRKRILMYLKVEKR